MDARLLRIQCHVFTGVGQGSGICVSILQIDQKEPTLDFQVLENDKPNIDFKNYLYCKKIVYPTKKEIDLHKQYLKSSFKKNFF